MDKESAEFNKTTFEPIIDNPVVESQEITPKPDSKVEVPTPVESPVDNQPVDNDTKQYQYWQSEAYRKENTLRERDQEIENLRQQMTQTQKPKDEIPPRPMNDDPNEWLQYNAKMNEYNAKLINELRTERQEEAKQKQEYEQQMYARQYALNQLTGVTKNPQKSQQELNFFANAKNLTPAVYNVMYDAAQAYLNQSSVVKPNFNPNPPIGGGEALKTKVTPDDEFNKQLGENNKYRL